MIWGPGSTVISVTCSPALRPCRNQTPFHCSGNSSRIRARCPSNCRKPRISPLLPTAPCLCFCGKASPRPDRTCPRAASCQPREPDEARSSRAPRPHPPSAGTRVGTSENTQWRSEIHTNLTVALVYRSAGLYIMNPEPFMRENPFTGQHPPLLRRVHFISWFCARKYHLILLYFFVFLQCWLSLMQHWLSCFQAQPNQICTQTIVCFIRPTHLQWSFSREIVISCKGRYPAERAHHKSKTARTWKQQPYSFWSINKRRAEIFLFAILVTQQRMIDTGTHRRTKVPQHMTAETSCYLQAETDCACQQLISASSHTRNADFFCSHWKWKRLQKVPLIVVIIATVGDWPQKVHQKYKQGIVWIDRRVYPKRSCPGGGWEGKSHNLISHNGSFKPSTVHEAQIARNPVRWMGMHLLRETSVFLHERHLLWESYRSPNINGELLLVFWSSLQNLSLHGTRLSEKHISSPIGEGSLTISVNF